MAEQLKKNLSQENTAMELKDIKLEDLAQARPDLVEAIKKSAKPAEEPPKFVTEAAFSEAVVDLTDAMDNVEKLVKSHEEKIAKSDPTAKIEAATTEVAALKKSVETLTAQVAEFAKSKSAQLPPDSADAKVKKAGGKFGNVFSVISAAREDENPGE